MNPSTLANEFGRFFQQKINSIHESLEVLSVSLPSPTSDDETCIAHAQSSSEPAPSSVLPCELSVFKALSIEEVQKLIARSPIKSCPLDPVPSFVLVQLVDILLPVLTSMINLSFETAHFADAWKETLLLPVLKKSGLEVAYKNFRPISNLCFASKLSERAAADQLTQHVIDHGLDCDLQSAYKEHHSTETALLKVKNDLLMSMDKQHVTLLVMLDLSAAFDTVCHSTLISRLESKFGVKGAALEWVRSYLLGRTQRVSVKGAVSENFDLRHGVPQGSCLGPLLFSLYTSKLFDITKQHLPNVICYADDTQLYVSFRPDESSGSERALDAMSDCIRDPRAWMISDKLMINDGKTEVLLVGTRHQLQKVNIDAITVRSSRVTPCTSVRNLGAWFDSQLTMNTHVNKVCSAAYFHLYNIKRIRKYLSQDTTEKLVHAFFSSRIDYCNSLLYGLPAKQLDKLQRVQNTAARIIFFLPKFCHITPVLVRLHWLPIKSRIHFKICLITVKVLHGLSPSYLFDLISVKKTRYSLRSFQAPVLNRPRTNRKTLGDRSFAAAAPTLWNALPQGIRQCQKINVFKCLLKTHLFRLAYNV